MDAITSDPAWTNGWYREPHAVREGLARHARLWALMGLSPALLKAEGWRTLGFSSIDDFLSGFLYSTFLPMEPNDLLCMARKWRDADVSRHRGGDLSSALRRIKARMTVMPISSDMFFVTADCAAEQRMVPRSALREVQTLWGHVGLFGTDPSYAPQIDAALNEHQGPLPRWLRRARRKIALRIRALATGHALVCPSRGEFRPSPRFARSRPFGVLPCRYARMPRQLGLWSGTAGDRQTP